ncbi:MAG TPA: alpha/beta hydrolase [Burkholderiaceae bacterium]|nr:alpha/beta hydrolase [Burkholderiaceae bacterium]
MSIGRLRLVVGSLLVGSCAFALADELLVIPTREGVTSSYWWMPRQNAKANLILLSGGSGGIGYRNGTPQSSNFLIRSRDHFATGNPSAAFNIALLGNATDMRQLDPVLRARPAHVQDIAAVVAHIRAKNNAPIWLVGTSQGTISAAAAAIELGDKLDGIVLSASFTSFKTATSVPKQAIDKIRVPVLVISHEKDSCNVTRPDENKYIIDSLKNARVKKMMTLTGGHDPTGNECEALHWHGFINFEAQASKAMTDWILKPTP